MVRAVALRSPQKWPFFRFLRREWAAGNLLWASQHTLSGLCLRPFAEQSITESPGYCVPWQGDDLFILYCKLLKFLSTSLLYAIHTNPSQSSKHKGPVQTQGSLHDNQIPYQEFYRMHSAMINAVPPTLPGRSCTAHAYNDG